MQKSLLTLVIAVTLVLVSLTAAFAASPEPLKSLSSLEVVDADGEKVAPMISLFQADSGQFLAVVVFEVDKQPFMLTVFTGGFRGLASGPFFESSDCSGRPLISDRPGLIASAAIAPQDRTVYVAEPDATPQTFINFQGTRLNNDGTCQPVSGGFTLTAARAVVDLDTLFTPPFSVR